MLPLMSESNWFCENVTMTKTCWVTGCTSGYRSDTSHGRHFFSVTAGKYNEWNCKIPRQGILTSKHYVCLSVRLSVKFVSCAKTSKRIFKFFSPSGSQAILVLPYQTAWQYSNGNPPNGGVECGGYEKIAIFDQYLAVSQKRLYLDGHMQRDNL